MNETSNSGRTCRINAARLHARLQELADLGRDAQGGVHRLALTEADGRGRDLVRGWMEEAGLTVRVDRIGNMFGLRPDKRGAVDDPAIMTGSHLDTVAGGGAYDGALGVLAGLEALQAMSEAGVETGHPTGVAVFTNEEGVRAQPDMMGSLVHCGDLGLDQALSTPTPEGPTLGEELERIGYAGDMAPGTIPFRAFLELHVEQGPLLDAEKSALGIVTSVQGLAWHSFTFHGQANHAGATPMPMRSDPGFLACALGAYLREICRDVDNELRATVGSISFEPGAVNVIPRTARMTVDLRSLDPDAITRAESLMLDFVEVMAKPEKIRVDHTVLAQVAPQAFDKRLLTSLEDAAGALGVPARRLTSGAGHDAQIIARHHPAAMLFVPSRKGISHAREEFTEPEHIETGANVLLQALLDLAG